MREPGGRASHVFRYCESGAAGSGLVPRVHFALKVPCPGCSRAFSGDAYLSSLAFPPVPRPDQVGAAGGQESICYLESLQKAQLTNRRMRTFITKPNDRKTNSVAEPP